MTPGATYCILAGVRRAKVFQLAGLTTIQAEIFDASSGIKIGDAAIPIDQLRSAKSVLDLTISSKQRARFESIEQAVRIGRQHRIPPIEVMPGVCGCLIANIVVIR